ncbi:MAG: helix-turn-helix transcriptional regulator [Neisseria sp.]|nr:helix-turn-helix transcriptional regulator [Neisseria sp.]
MNTLSQLVGKNIRRHRISSGINQESLALMAEIDRSYMGRIERGEVNITVDKLYQICSVLQCEAADLLPSLDELGK